MKFTLFITMLFALFSNPLFSQDTAGPDGDIQALSAAPDFDVIHEINDNLIDESRSDTCYMDIEEKHTVYFMVNTEGFNVLNLPYLMANAAIFHKELANHVGWFKRSYGRLNSKKNNFT